jgi:rubrerythrin
MEVKIMENIQNFRTISPVSYSLYQQSIYPTAIQKEVEKRTFNSKIESNYDYNEILEIIKDSINDESKDTALYLRMINQAIQNEDKDILESIANDEKKHNLMLKQIYLSLTGQNVNTTKTNTDIAANTYITNLKNSLFDELKAAKKYRKVLSHMSDKENYNKLMEIMIDELTHANKFNYLITKYLINQKETCNQ